MSTDLAEAPKAENQPALAVEDSAKRRQILEGARQVFLRDGFDGASMNDVARVAGVSKGTLYVYFDNKEDLFEALIRQERRTQAERVCVFDAGDHDVRAVLTRFALSLWDMHVRQDTLSHLRAIMAVAGKFPRFGQAFYEAGPGYGIGVLAAYLAKQVEAGVLAMDDPELAAAQFLELAHAGLLKPLIFQVVTHMAQEKITRNVASAVDMFMAYYSAGPK